MKKLEQMFAGCEAAQKLLAAIAEFGDNEVPLLGNPALNTLVKLGILAQKEQPTTRSILDVLEEVSGRFPQFLPLQRGQFEELCGGFLEAISLAVKSRRTLH